MTAGIPRTAQDSSPHPPTISPTPSSSGPSNEDIEAVIQMATSASNGRTPAPKDTRTQLFVGNLPYRVRWQDLKDLFRKAGTVLRADVSLGPDNRSRGFGTVLLATAEDAGRAVDMFNGYNWQTRTLEVRPDRIAPDFDNSIAPIAAPNATYHPPGYTFSVSPAHPIPYTSVPPDSILTGNTSSLSLPTLPPSLDESNQGFSLSRPGTAAGNSGRNLFVGNLPFHCQWQDLKDLFRQAGTILRADVALGPDGRSRGFGTVVFATDPDAERGVKMFNGYEFNGRALKVHYDKFLPAQSSTVPTSPAPQMTFQTASSFSGGFMNPPPQHIPIPFQYPDFGTSSAPSSPFDIYPPYVMMQHQQQQRPSPANQENRLPTDTQTQSSETISSTVANPPTPLVSVSSSSSSSLNQSTPSSGTHHHHPGRIALPPPSVSGFSPPHALSPHPISPHHHPMSPMHHQHVLSMTPHGLPPITPSMPSFTFLPQLSPSIHGPPHHANPPTPGYEGVSGALPGHIMIPYAPFSPGLTMSPGAFWGHPGPGVNPYAAVGAPVHVQHTPYNVQMEDPGGYFPPVPPQDYFPLVSTSSSLANEVKPDNYVDEYGRNQVDQEERSTPGSDSVTTSNGESRHCVNSWPTRSEDGDDKDIEIITGSMEAFKLKGQHLQPRSSSFGSAGHNRTMEFEGGRHSKSSMNSPRHIPNGVRSLGHEPIQAGLDQSSHSTSTTAARSAEHRRASFAEVVSEGSSPANRKAVAVGLGISVPNT